jgi:hypothetical protein
MSETITDPALYRIYAFLLEDLENDSTFFTRSILPALAKSAQLSYSEPAKKPQSRKIVYLWDAERSLSDGGYFHGLARSYDTDAVVVFGLEDIRDAERDGWLSKNAHRLEAALDGFEQRSDLFRSSNDKRKNKQLMLLGRMWVYTAEWKTPPDDWDEFARSQYQQGGYALFNWG